MEMFTKESDPSFHDEWSKNYDKNPVQQMVFLFTFKS